MRPIDRPSHPLADRLESLDGCAGRWILDLRDSDQRGYDLHHLPTYVPGLGTLTAAQALAHCQAVLWRGARLLYCADRLNDDCSWPGGYSAPSIYRSNARVFRDEFSAELERADGDADGISLDLRYITPEMIETLESLEDYPLISEDDHSELELELQGEAWESWAAADWRQLITRKLQKNAAPDCDDPDSWAEDALEKVSDEALEELFNAVADQTCTYWEESNGEQWVDLERAAAGVDLQDLRELTGLRLLPPDQQWRREPYPWPDGSAAPLITAP